MGAQKRQRHVTFLSLFKAAIAASHLYCVVTLKENTMPESESVLTHDKTSQLDEF